MRAASQQQQQAAEIQRAEVTVAMDHLRQELAMTKAQAHLFEEELAVERTRREQLNGDLKRINIEKQTFSSTIAQAESGYRQSMACLEQTLLDLRQSHATEQVWGFNSAKRNF